jgi:endonuclease/exonuclease/phosphatase (EEP) superfamily protein YafD
MGEGATSDHGYTLQSLLRDFVGSMRRAFLLIALVALASLLPFDSLFLDILSHFQMQYLVIILSGLLLLWKGFTRRARALMIAGLFTTSYMVFPQFMSNANSCSKCEYHEKFLGLMLANVNALNMQYQEFIDSVPEDIEILGLLEINHAWEQKLAPLRRAYPHVRSYPNVGFFGLSLYSKFPIESVEVIEHPSKNRSDSVKSVYAKIRTGQGLVSVLLTHPYSPQSLRGFELRNQQLANIADLIKGREDNLILMADLNTSPWSNAFRAFVRGTELNDARNGFGLISTWPAHVPALYERLLAVPIDYILLGEDFKVVEVSTLRIKGSDHRALVAKVRMLKAQD